MSAIKENLAFQHLLNSVTRKFDPLPCPFPRSGSTSSVTNHGTEQSFLPIIKKKETKCRPCDDDAKTKSSSYVALLLWNNRYRGRLGPTNRPYTIYNFFYRWYFIPCEIFNPESLQTLYFCLKSTEIYCILFAFLNDVAIHNCKCAPS